MGGPDVAMEQGNPPTSAQDSGQSQLNPQKMADFVNDKIYERLQLQFRNEMDFTKAVVVKAKHMRDYIDASKLQDNETKVAITATINARIEDAYEFLEEEEIDVAAAVAKALIDNTGRKSLPPASRHREKFNSSSMRSPRPSALAMLT
ncbi:hypothetical protein V7S43_015190 [Phytophthora oleae]|uniref:Uncharacterized protein n=1 Tax=Phytophthora oleae TaxID=2107226 RepID=A0ABD3EZK7_9STRA